MSVDEQTPRRPRRRTAWIAAGAVVIVVAAVLVWVLVDRDGAQDRRIEALDGVAVVERSEFGLERIRLDAGAAPADVARIVEVVREGGDAETFSVLAATASGVGERRLDIGFRTSRDIETLGAVLLRIAEIPGDVDLAVTQGSGLDGGAAVVGGDGPVDRAGVGVLRALAEALEAEPAFGAAVTRFEVGVEFRGCDSARDGEWTGVVERVGGLADVLEAVPDAAASGWLPCDRSELQFHVGEPDVAALFTALDDHLQRTPQSTTVTVDRGERDPLVVGGRVGDDPAAGLSLVEEFERLGATVESVSAGGERLTLGSSSDAHEAVQEAITELPSSTWVEWTGRDRLPFDPDASGPQDRRAYFRGTVEMFRATAPVRAAAERAECGYAVAHSPGGASETLRWELADPCAVLGSERERAPLLEALRAADAIGLPLQALLAPEGLPTGVAFAWEPGGAATGVDLGGEPFDGARALVEQFDATAPR